MFDRTIINIFSNIWPMLVIVMTIVIKSMLKRNIPVDKVSTSVLHENKEGE